MIVYADTSFLVSSYVRDGHSPHVDEMLKSHPCFWFTPLHQAEWTHAIAHHVFRRLMSDADANAIGRQLEGDKAGGVWIETTLPDHAFELCSKLARRHGAKLGIRTLDSLHVACALELKVERFWTFDERQARLARAMGLKTQ